MSVGESKRVGQTAIVSGAARGLGLAFAQALAEQGAAVVMFDRSDEVRSAGERLARETGSRIRSLVADVSRREDVERVVAEAVSEHGGVDILVNNAGTWRQTPVDSDWQQTLDDWDFIMDTNLKGVLMLSRACVPHMKGRANANIINISTYYVLPARSGGTNQPHTDLYNASKWALNGFTDAWAGHLAADGIRVNALAMGAVDTPMLRNLFDGGKLPSDLADVVMQPRQIAEQMMALIDEGPGGRTGENIGAWVGHPVELSPRRPPHERITGINVRIEQS